MKTYQKWYQRILFFLVAVGLLSLAALPLLGGTAQAENSYVANETPTTTFTGKIANPCIPTPAPNGCTPTPTFTPTSTSADPCIPTPFPSGCTPTPTSTVVPDNIDLSVVSVEAVQAVEGQQLIVDKQTTVKVVVHMNNAEAVNNVPVSVYQSGSTYSEFYILDPANTKSLGTPHNVVSFAPGEDTKILYFFDNSLTPNAEEGANYIVTAAIDPLNQLSESIESNNVASSNQDVIYINWGGNNPTLSIGFVKMDWNSNWDDEYTALTTETEAFIKGAFPVASNRVEFKHLSGNTSSLFWKILNFGAKFNQVKVGELITDQHFLITQFNQEAKYLDRVVLIVPSGWFNENTDLPEGAEGISFPSMPNVVLAETGRATNPFLNVVHELGHTMGFNNKPVCEDYYEPPTCIGAPNRIGSRIYNGVWVEYNRPMIHSSQRGVYSFMGTFEQDVEYWITDKNYNEILANDEVAAASLSQVTIDNTRGIQAFGHIGITGTVSLDNWYTVEGLDYDLPRSGTHAFLFLDERGEVLYEYQFSPFVYTGHLEEFSEAVFSINLPFVDGTSKIQLIENTHSTVLDEKQISLNQPKIKLSEPTQDAVADQSLVIKWQGTDEDSDQLTYSVAVSADNGITWEFVVRQTMATEFQWETKNLKPGEYQLRLIVSDGFFSVNSLSTNLTVDHTMNTRQSIFMPIVMK